MNTIRHSSDHPYAASCGNRDPFAHRFGVSLPRDLARAGGGMTWTDFVEAYAPTAGPVRLSSWTEMRRTAGLPEFEATLGIDDRISSTRIEAAGPIAALTAILYDAGYGVEILSFHQRAVAVGLATFVLCERAGRCQWAFAIHSDHTESALRAIIAGANMLGNSTIRRSEQV
ncbi:alpha-isopropylmalate synthase regulatory domain-containing protein [Antrihabitans cavernicola]|uniref:2-isopropylmalate synthase n=1 Tax=Antrihabitans cavernicola TaxID=2495913 RepID=A0A5A7S6C8_9NOCA|nr:alpha-isopropylmalate synthase regulatory domain-containing protein [Spelaeibacter cavernicola]KAA0021446.1 2-isopropylmalate synthase [Spelaeibacter cavernicola]